MAPVFGTMAVHLGLRVLVLDVGSIFGIALAVTFAIVKRKQVEISQLRRLALDSLHAFELDIKEHGLANPQGKQIS